MARAKRAEEDGECTPLDAARRARPPVRALVIARAHCSLARTQAVAVPGQALKSIARGSGIPIKYDCQEGTCKTCTSSIGKICVLKVPRKDVTVKYNIKG